MRQAPAPPPFISYFMVPTWPPNMGQIVTRCLHPDCGDGHPEGHLLSIDVTFALAALKAAAHSATHQPTDKAS
jgi:hypothetical protein